MGVRLGALALLLTIGVRLGSDGGQTGVRRGSDEGQTGVRRGSDEGQTPEQKTTRDKIYSKEQATRGGELFVKYCEKCHIPEKVPAGKKADPPLIGPKFLDTWIDRPLGELFGTIFNTMPSDGTATLTADQALDAVAHILQLNGYPDGPAPLKNDDAMKTAVIVK